MSQRVTATFLALLLVVMGAYALVAQAQPPEHAKERMPAHARERVERAQGEKDKDPKQVREHVNMFEDVQRGVAVLHPTQGNNVRGVVHFIEQENGRVTVRAIVSGLQPNSTHAIHVHEYGDCTAPDATSAGDHYNPEDQPHGLPEEPNRHAGDFGNLQADAQGNATKELTVGNITVAGLQNPVLGRAVIVHASEDTGAQPTGEAGARLACGVIGVANPESARGNVEANRINNAPNVTPNNPQNNAQDNAQNNRRNSPRNNAQ